MKRKIVKHGPSSYIITLPLNWIRYNNLQKGAEVNLIENNNKIIVSSDIKERETILRAEIHLHEQKNIIESVINSLYEKGVDEIKIYYKDSEDFQYILKALEVTDTSFEIIDTRNKACLLKKITKISGEFDPVFRRSFLIALTLTEGVCEIIEKQDFSEIDNLLSLSKSNRKLTLFCRRFINKHSLPDREKIGPTYLVISTINNIVNTFKYLANSINLLNIKNGNIEVCKDLKNYFVQLNKSFRLVYEAYYSFNLNNVVSIKNKNTELRNMLIEKSMKLKTKQDIFVCHFATILNSHMYTLIDAIILLGTKTKISQF